MDSSTQAQTSGQQPVNQVHSASLIEGFAPLLLVFAALYFIVLRPQKKREEKKRAMLSELKKGDRILTIGGILGTVHKVSRNNDEISVEIAENVNIKILRNAISTILKGEESANSETSASKADLKPENKKKVKEVK